MQDSFLKTNDRLINLQNVSNINILRGEKRNRIIFNMNYNIEIYPGKHISDYVYWDAIDDQDLIYNIKHLQFNEYLQKNFIDQPDGKGYINVNEISSIKFAEKKNRVIFNLSHPVSFNNHKKDKYQIEQDRDVLKLTSEFVYVNCTSFDKYKKYVEYVQQELGDN